MTGYERIELPSSRGWRYGAMVTTLSLPALEAWRSYRGRDDCENYIKKLKADLSLNSFNVNDLYETETALGFVMQTYSLMNLSLGKPCTRFGTIHPRITETFSRSVLAQRHNT